MTMVEHDALYFAGRAKLAFGWFPGAISIQLFDLGLNWGQPSLLLEPLLGFSAKAATAFWINLTVSFCACVSGKPLASVDPPRMACSSVPWYAPLVE